MSISIFPRGCESKEVIMKYLKKTDLFIFGSNFMPQKSCTINVNVFFLGDDLIHEPLPSLAAFDLLSES